MILSGADHEIHGPVPEGVCSRSPLPRLMPSQRRQETMNVKAAAHHQPFWNDASRLLASLKAVLP